MIIRETRDIAEIKNVLCDPEIYARISDDFSPSIDSFEPVPPSDYVYYLTDENNIGLVFLHWHNGTMLEGHIQVLEDHRHLAHEFAVGVLDWIWNNTQAKKILAVIPEIYPDVIGFTKKMGFEQEGEIKGSYQKNGVLYSQVYLGISR